MDIVIKKGVAIPQLRHSREKYPWAEMESGDCIDVPLEAGNSAASSARGWLARHNRAGWTVVQRKTNSGTVTIWLLAPEEKTS